MNELNNLVSQALDKGSQNEHELMSLKQEVQEISQWNNMMEKLNNSNEQEI